MACKVCVHTKFFEINKLHAEYVVKYRIGEYLPTYSKLGEDLQEYQNKMIKIMNEKCPECSGNNCEHEFKTGQKTFMGKPYLVPICSKCGYEPNGLI